MKPEFENNKAHHPAFGKVVISRPQGHGVNLFGCEYTGPSRISITVYQATSERKLSEDFNHKCGKPILKFEMSESQYGRMLSSIGIGDGTECTLRTVCGESIPEIDNFSDKTEVYKEEFLNDVDISNKLNRLVDEIMEMKFSQKHKKEIIEKLTRVSTKSKQRSKFIVDQFEEYMEKRIKSAKAEINGYLTNIGGSSIPQIDVDKLKLGNEYD